MASKKFQLHEMLDTTDLQLLEEQFTTTMSMKGLKEKFNLEEFVAIMKFCIKPDICFTELEAIFNQIDFRSSGFCTWKSLLLYLQNEIQVANQTMLIGNNIESELSESINLVHAAIHEDIICRIDIVPLNFHTEIGFSNARYATISREGTIALWSPSWKLHKHTNINNPLPPYRKVKTNLLDMVTLANVNLIGISCSDDTVRFFDAHSLDLLFILNGLASTVTALSYWFDPLEPSFGTLLIGDNSGSVTVMHFTDCLVNKAFGPNPGKQKAQTIAMHDIMSGSKSFINVIKYRHLHNDWVKQLRYEPYLKTVMSCSNSSNGSLILIREGPLCKDNWVFNVPRGVICFDFNVELNLLATGGTDRLIRIWNPKFTSKAMMSFIGHGSPVTNLFFPDDRVFSISSDKILKVWDTKNENCIQNVLLFNIPFGTSPIASAYYNSYKRTFFVAANDICVIHRLARECDILDSNIDIFVSHPAPITGIVYSIPFNQVVSVCNYGMITAWDLNSGHRVVQVQKAHSVMQCAEEIPVAISAVCLDDNGKRLITCGLDGYLKVWNLGSGCFLINSVPIPEKQTILTMISLNGIVFYAGWSKRIYTVDLNTEGLKSSIWRNYHTDDILSLSILQSNILISSSWDGNIGMWHIDNELLQSLTLVRFLTQRQMTGSSSSRALDKSKTSTSSTKTSTSSTKTSSTTSFKSYINEIKRRTTSLSKTKSISHSKSKDKVKTKTYSSSNVTEQLCPIVCVLCLQSRPVKPFVGNLIAADILGRIQVWSTTSPAAALAVFASVTKEHDYTTCMTTDSQNKYLITGDTRGFLKIWYIRHYCADSLQLRSFAAHSASSEIKKFPFLRRKLRMVANKTLQKLQALIPYELEDDVEITHPLLLSFYQAHVQALSAIIFVDNKDIIITSSIDHSIRLWTLHGRFLGIFGDPRGWDLIKLLTPPFKSKDRKIPGDVRRVCSATTLQVMFSGLSPRWWKLREAFLFSYMRAILIRKVAFTQLPAASEELRKVSAPISLFALRKLSKKAPPMGPPLGENFSIPTKSCLQTCPTIPSELMRKTLTIVHKYVPCYELDHLSLVEAKNIMSNVSSKTKNSL